MKDGRGWMIRNECFLTDTLMQATLLFRINGRYSVDLDEHIQHQTNDKNKQRSIKRHPAADGWDEDDEEDSGDDDEHQFSEDDDEEYEDDGGDDDDDDEYQEEEEEESD
mmetsp:Transcript_3613/g.5714  ORF Transcript_3613/g.5714 Transcript_3613/m.5714 type:complete len:109 (-) Transcript_3613:134-460(-)